MSPFARFELPFYPVGPGAFASIHVNKLDPHPISSTLKQNSLLPHLNLRLLQPRINLINKVITRPRIPRLAGLGNCCREGLRLNIGWAFEDLDIETCRNMPRNMAM
jgi:hypothetical protein